MISFKSKISVAAAAVLTAASLGAASPVSAGPIVGYFAFSYQGSQPLVSQPDSPDYLKSEVGGVNATVSASGLITGSQITAAEYASYMNVTEGAASIFFDNGSSVYRVTNVTGTRSGFDNSGNAGTLNISGPVTFGAGYSPATWAPNSPDLATAMGIDNLLYVHADGSAALDSAGIGFYIYSSVIDPNYNVALFTLRDADYNILYSVDSSFTPDTSEVDTAISLGDLRITQVPEPSSVAILGLVLLMAGLGLVRNRKSGVAHLSVA